MAWYTDPCLNNPEYIGTSTSTFYKTLPIGPFPLLEYVTNFHDPDSCKQMCLLQRTTAMNTTCFQIYHSQRCWAPFELVSTQCQPVFSRRNMSWDTSASHWESTSQCSLTCMASQKPKRFLFFSFFLLSAAQPAAFSSIYTSSSGQPRCHDAWKSWNYDPT